MEKKQYENMKQLKNRIENEIANFKERNVWNIIQKKKVKNKSYHLKAK